MYLLIIFLPLLGASFAGFGGKFLGSKGAIFITISCLFISLIFSIIAFYEIAFLQNICYINSIS